MPQAQVEAQAGPQAQAAGSNFETLNDDPAQYMDSFRKPQRKRSRQERQKAYSTGWKSEILTIFFLMLKGYWPLHYRCRMSGGEIDLVMRRRRLLIFVEIKARASHLEAAEALGHCQQKRLHQASDQWLSRFNPGGGFQIRHDLVTVSHQHFWPRHYKNAF